MRRNVLSKNVSSKIPIKLFRIESKPGHVNSNGSDIRDTINMKALAPAIVQ